MAKEDWSDLGTPVQAADDDWSDLGTPVEVKQNKSTLADLGTDLKRGGFGIPGVATGGIDLLAGVFGLDRPADKAANAIGDLTGFKPSQWAKEAEAEYSPTRTASREDIERAWKEGGIGNIASAYVRNPAATLGNVVESVPSMLVGGIAGKGIQVASKMSPILAGAMGEGLVTAGQGMDQTDRSVDPTKAALSNLAAGAITAGIGTASGKLSRRLGLEDIETAMAGGKPVAEAGEKVAEKMPLYKRVPAGMVSEGLLEELPQSMQEQAWQNVAEGKDVGEGVARAGVEGALAGGVMGAGANVFSRNGSKYEQKKIDEAKEEISGLLPAPIETGTPNDQILQEEVARQNSMDAAQKSADQIYAERDAYEKAMQALYPAGMPTVTEDIEPLQQHIDAMLGIDRSQLKGLQRTRYQKDLEAAFNEPVGITHDKDGKEIPLTMGELLDSQATAEQQAKSAGARVYAREQSEARQQQLSEEESYVPPDAPVSDGPIGKALFAGGIGQRAVQAQKIAVENANGAIAQNTANADMVTSRAQGQGGELPRGGSVLEPAPVGNTNAVVSSPEVATPGMRPAVAAGESSQDNLTNQSQQGTFNVAQATQAIQAAPQGQKQQSTAVGAESSGNIVKPEVRAYQKGQAMMLSGRMTKQGMPSEIYPHPTQPGMFAIGVAGQNKTESTPSGARSIAQEETNGQETASPALTTPVANRSNIPPNQRRDDLVGAILRATGGDGIASSMADTIVGDKANKVGKLRGLFTNAGQQNLGDLAMMLREQEGYDVRDASHLEELIRASASGDVPRSMARQEADAEAAKEKQHRDEIRKQAKKLGIKTVAREFNGLEQEVIRSMEQRHTDAIEKLDTRARERYDAMLKRALEISDYDEVDAIITDAHNRFSGREFYFAAIKQLRGYIDDIVIERQSQETNNAIEDVQATDEEPDWLRTGSEESGSRVAVASAPEEARSQPDATEEVAPTLELAGQSGKPLSEDSTQPFAGAVPNKSSTSIIASTSGKDSRKKVAPTPNNSAKLAEEGKQIVKEPWQMTRREWGDAKSNDRAEHFGSAGKRNGAAETLSRIDRKTRLNYGVEETGEPVDHKQVIEKAISEGKTIPENVLSDYPDLTENKPVIKETEKSVALESRRAPDNVQPEPIFFLHLARQIESAPDRVFGPAQQFKLWLTSNAAKLGIKKDEIAWSGINDWLDTQKKVAKADVLNYLEQGGVQVQEVMKGASTGNKWKRNQLYSSSGEYIGTLEDAGNSFGFVFANDSYFDTGESRMDRAIAKIEEKVGDTEPEGEATKFGQYTLPGGSDYRELLLTLPKREGVWSDTDEAEYKRLNGMNNRGELDPRKNPDGNRMFNELLERRKNRDSDTANFRSGHWDEPNVIAHIRFNSREDAEGNRVLFIEEIQSDWGQKGKKEGFAVKEYPYTLRANPSRGTWDVVDWKGNRLDSYQSKEEAQRVVNASKSMKSGVPSAPFVTDTKAWVALALKRMMRYAADNGFDKIAFVNGEQSAERYDLSKQISSIDYYGDERLIAYGPNGKVFDRQVSPDGLEEVIGKEAAKKLMDSPLEKTGDHVAQHGNFRDKRELRGEELKVGGEGMKAFYNNIVPQVANDVLKKLGGGKVETIGIRTLEDGISQQQGFTIPNSMAEKIKTEGVPLFSIGNKTEQTSALDSAVSEVKAIVGEFRKQFKGTSALTIRVVGSTNDIPAQFRPSPYAEGVYHDNAGIIYLVGNNLLTRFGKVNSSRVWQVLLHESVGHFGLAKMMGDRFKVILRAVKNIASDPTVKKDIYEPGDKQYATVEAVKLRYPEASDTEVAQEVLSRMAESDPTSTRLRYIKAIVRQWLRDVARFFRIEVSVTAKELNDLILMASEHLRKGKNLETETMPSGLVAASRKSGVQSAQDSNSGNEKSPVGTGSKPLVPLGVIRKAALAARDSGTNILTEEDVVNSHGAQYSTGKDDLRNRYQWAATSDTEKGPVFAGSDFVLDPIGLIPTEDGDFVNGGMAEHGLMGHAAHATPGATTIEFSIGRNGIKIGELVADVLHGDVVAIHDFEVYNKSNGDGSKIVAHIVANTYAPVRVVEALEQSKDFWKKVGADEFDQFGNGQIDWQGSSRYLVGKPGKNQSGRDGAQVQSAGYGDDGFAVQELSEDEIKALEAQGFRFGKVFESRARIIGDSGRDYNQQQRAFFKAVGRDINPKNRIEKTVDYLKSDFWKKMATGLVDQFRGLRDLEDNGSAYMLARLSKGTAGAFETLLHHGKLSIRDGVYDGDRSGGFVERLGIPLHGELDDVLWWIAANRAEGLTGQGKENLFSAEDIAAGKSLASGVTDFDYTIQTGSGKGTVTRLRAAMYADAHRIFNEFQKNTLDMAEQSGLIDGSTRKYWESEFYVPFYRVSEEEGEFIGAKMGSALVRQQAFKKLKGGTDKLNSDLLSNTLLNWSHLLEASAKNRAAKAALTGADNIGVAQRVAESMTEYATSNGMLLPPGTKKTVWYMDGGKKVEYLVSDPFVMTAITSLEYAGMKNFVMDSMTKFKNVLTIGVTASPAFKVRNLIRDSIQAIGTSELSYNPVKNVVEGFKQTNRASQEYVSALASGGLIRFGTMLEGSESSRVRQLIKSGVKDSTILNSENKWRAFYDQYIDPGVTAYNELGNRSEEINRAALYNQLIKQGKSHGEAALLARDLMDFSMQGSFNTIRFLGQVVPFFNARLQGMYKLGRSAKDNPRKMAVVTGAVALASIALMAANGDDDDWKRREDWDRDNFWWFKFGGIEYRIPKPFEIGAVASLAERSVEYLMNDEMTGERFRKVVLSLAENNLSMNPSPQLVKPIVDLYANKDSFTGRPIETMSMQRLESTMRFNSNTSMVARGISTAMMGSMSPVQVDHLARAYFGWLGSFVVGGADMAIRAVSDEPTKPALDYFKFATQGMMKEAGTSGSRYLTMLYDQATELEQAYGTYRQLLKDGKIEEAKNYAMDNADKLRRYKSIEAVKRTESKMNENIRLIEKDRNLSSDEKKVRIENIQKLKEQIAKRVAPGVYGP